MKAIGNYIAVGDSQGALTDMNDLVHTGAGRRVAAAACAWHGYKRNNSIVWALVWAGLGYLAPVITPTIGVAQGFAQKKPCP